MLTVATNIYTILTLTVAIASVQASTDSTELRSEMITRIDYRVPENPPGAHYSIDCSINPAKGFLEGTEVICFKNTTSQPIYQLAIKWVSYGKQSLEIKSDQKTVLSLTEKRAYPAVFRLPKPVGPNEKAILEIKFSVSAPVGDEDKFILTDWYPRLWWGFETHDDYDVKLEVPIEYTVAASGLLDREMNYYRAKSIRCFGLFIGKGFKSIETNAKDVLVQVVYKAEAEECAQLVLETAVQAINFYRKRFGFYPYQNLTIVPGGMTHPAGGYPIATNIVGIHAMEQFNSKPKTHWQWITAHEIGHQYCGEHILSKDPADSFNWLMIGLGIYADRELARAHGINSKIHRSGFVQTYINGVRKGFDTTINITPEQRSKIKFDFNNVVEHGKSYSVISALDCVLGKGTFSRIYQRCLDEFGGRRLGVSEFQAICEEESNQDLGWFFGQWVNSNKFLSYKISSKKCEKQGNGYKSEIEVKCLGDLKMPVPVAVYFEDGTSQTQFTDRLKDINILEFKSSSPLKEVRLDPERVLAFASVVPPAPIRPAEFEIVDVEFEPIHQGKNVVWVKVRNTSPEAQTFDINVYSRSPEYGEGMGWGRGVLGTIKRHETRRMRFPFKIQGPITDATYISLAFYNPGPAADFDQKKWKQQRKDENPFKKIKYMSSDLEKLQVDKDLWIPAESGQAEGIIEAFQQIQAHIRDKNYEQAWQLFTRDYQKVEYNDKLNRFKEVMERQSMASIFLWDKMEFLSLQPKSVTKNNDLFTLTALFQDSLWTIDFTLDEEQWKIDWVGGYVPAYVKGYWDNWEQRLLPTMQKRSTENFDIYYFKDSTAEKEIDQIAQQKEKGFRQICRFLGKSSDARICMVFFEDGMTKQIETGHQGVGWAYGNTIVEIYNEKQKLDPYHETTHVLMRPYGGPPALFNEGFAVYMSEKLGAHALEDLGGGQATIYARARELKSKGEWIDLEQLITYTEIGSAKSRPTLAYPEAASFVKFLIDKYGRDKFLQAYKRLKNSDDETIHQQNIKKLTDIYNRSLKQLEGVWKETGLLIL